MRKLPTECQGFDEYFNTRLSQGVFQFKHASHFGLVIPLIRDILEVAFSWNKDQSSNCYLNNKRGYSLFEELFGDILLLWSACRFATLKRHGSLTRAANKSFSHYSTPLCNSTSSIVLDVTFASKVGIGFDRCQIEKMNDESPRSPAARRDHQTKIFDLNV